MTENTNGGWTSQMLKSIDKDIPPMDKGEMLGKVSEMLNQPNQFEPKPGEFKQLVDDYKSLRNSYDPAPTAEAVAQERLSSLLADVTTTTLDQLRELRDEIDSLMQAIRNRDDLINKAFKEHVAYARNAIKCKEIVQSSLTKIKHDFNNGMHPIPQTVTVQESK